jgi:hypothetical protein
MDKRLRKGFLVGLGITLMTKEAMEKEVKKFMRENNLTGPKGKIAAKEFITEIKKYNAKYVPKLKAELKKAEKVLVKKGKTLAKKAHKKGVRHVRVVRKARKKAKKKKKK